jgi:hypothetical protein
VGQLNNGFQVNVIRNGRGETTAQKNKELEVSMECLATHLVITMYAAEGKHAMY